MSLKFKFISTLTVAGAIAVFSGASIAQDAKPADQTGDKVEKHQRHGGDREGFGHRKFGRRGFGMRGGHGMFGMMRGIELTDAQREQVKALREANKPDKSQFEALKPLMEARRNGTLTDDQKAQLKAFREQRQAKMKAMHEQFLSILTADQRAQLEKNQADMKARREEFKQKREEWRKNRENRKGDAAPAAKPGTDN
jgi:protein CpxP